MRGGTGRACTCLTHPLLKRVRLASLCIAVQRETTNKLQVNCISHPPFTCIAQDAPAHGLCVSERQQRTRLGRALEAVDVAAAPAAGGHRWRGKGVQAEGGRGWGRPSPAVMTANIEAKGLAAAHAHVCVAVQHPGWAGCLPQLPNEFTLRHL